MAQTLDELDRALAAQASQDGNPTNGPPQRTLIALGLLLPLTAGLVDRAMGEKPRFDEEHTWGWKRFALTAASAGLIMLLQLAGLLPCWGLGS